MGLPDVRVRAVAPSQWPMTTKTFALAASLAAVILALIAAVAEWPFGPLWMLGATGTLIVYMLAMATAVLTAALINGASRRAT